MAIDNYLIRKTGSDDNERAQLNKALREISDILQRSESWDAAVSWGDHNEAGYATALTETEQFFALGSPQNLTLSQEIKVFPNGTERVTVTATWNKIPDTSIVYDLEIRQTDDLASIDPTDPADVLANSDLYGVPIVSNEEDGLLVRYSSDLEPGLGYLFRVRIRRDSLVSPWGEFKGILTLTADDKPEPPSAPTIQAVIEGAQLSWTFPSNTDNVEKTFVLRREAGQPTDAIVGSVAKPGDTFNDGNLDSSKTYEYSLKTVSYRGVESDQTNRISMQPLPVEADFDTPAVPTGLSQSQEIITGNTGSQAFVNVDLSWNRVTGDNITYDLDIVRDGSTPVSTPVISNPDSGNPNYEFQVPVNTPLAVKVRSRNATAVSAFSGTLSFTANEDSNGVDGVEQVTFTPLYQGALINWVNPDNPNFKYVIVERRREAPSPIDWQVVGTVVRPTSFLFDDVGELSLDANDNVENAYRYKITPYSSAGVSGPSYESPNNSSADWIVPSNIPPDSITADQIVANSITAQEIETTTIAADTAFVNALNANSVFVSGIEQATSLNVTILSDNPPTTRADGSAIKLGDMWLDTNNGDKPHSYDGRVPFNINGWIPSYTIIDGGNITTGTIDASLVNVENINATNINTGLLDADIIDATVLSAIAADLGTITAGSITLNTSGFIRSGQTGYNNGTGFFLGIDGGIPKFSVGSSFGNSILWNGSTFTVNGKIIDGQNNIVSGSISADDITTGTLNATTVNVTNINAGNITTGTLNVDRIENDIGAVKFSTVLQSVNPPYISGQQGWAIGVKDGTAAAEFDNFNARGTVTSNNYSSGSAGWQVNALGNAEFNDITARGSLVTGLANAERVEITPSSPSTDRDYRIWVGANAKNQDNGRFWVDVNGNAKFGGRVSAAQLEGPVFDGVPINVTGSLTSAGSTTWVTIADRYIEIPETIQRPRRPFVSLAVPVFGSTSEGAWVRCQFAIQNDNGTWGSFFTVGQEYTQDTTSVGSAAPISIGSTSTGKRGFRVRVQFKAATAGQTAEANRWSGLFIALPAGSGFTIRQDSTGSAVSTTSPDTSILIPPDFGNGWVIP